MSEDLISRQAAIDAPKRFTKDCNPEHFVGHSNFIEYMDTVGIRSFGNWQYANGFNMGLTAAEVAIEKLPSTQRKGKWIPGKELSREFIGITELHIEYEKFTCSSCGLTVKDLLYHVDGSPFYKFCPNCGAEMEKEKE